MILTIAALITLSFIACDRDAPTQPVVRAGKATDDDCAFCDLFDAFNAQEEAAKTDSTSSKGGPDLIVQSPSASAVMLTPGQAFTLHVTVHNQGDQQAAATMLHYYRSNNATITASDTEVGTDAVDALDASAASAESIELTASVGVERYYGACVESVRGESNTDNNCSSAVKITVNGQQEDAQDDSTGSPATVMTDSLVLVAFYHATGGPDWDQADNWLSDQPLGQWHGIGTDEDGSILSIQLYDNYLVGVIPPELGQLDSLELLQLERNHLTGPIPSELGQLGQLVYLYLGMNELTGNIPPELGQLGALRHLWLRDNQLTGAIPPELGQLSKLKSLELIWNQLTGRIPSQLGDLPRLNHLYLGEGNQFVGCIPSTLSKIRDHDLTSLGISWCNSDR